MPPKKSAKKAADEIPSTSKSPLPQRKTRAAQRTFEEILAAAPLPPPPVVQGPKGHASHLDESQLENEVLIQEIPESNSDEDLTDDEDDWKTDDEIDEQLVVVEVNGFIDPVSLHKKIDEDLVRLRHPESETPTLQIGGQLFAGKYKEADGSVLVIEEKNDSETPTFTLEGITDVLLETRKTYLFAKGEDESQPGEEVRKPIELRATQKSNKALSTNIRKKN